MGKQGLTVLPEDHLLIGIDYLADNERSFVIEPRENVTIRMVQQLRRGYSLSLGR